VSVQKLGPWALFGWIAIAWSWWKDRQNPALLSVTLFILFHHLLGHKELRFLFPVLPLLPLLLFSPLLQLSKTRFSGFKWLFWVPNGVLLAYFLIISPRQEVTFLRDILRNQPVDRALYVCAPDPSRYMIVSLPFYNREKISIRGPKEIPSGVEVDLLCDRRIDYVPEYAPAVKENNCELVRDNRPPWRFLERVSSTYELHRCRRD
jgi:phosphatidylinositol glycan class B